ncbi:MAG: hypothetical protein PUP91_32750 [Rhizonema sp. PD37]|nr:hypothetical protein [Rhizonema sp. PD37]
MLLNTYLLYLKLDLQSKDAFFAGLRQQIEDDFGSRLQLSSISAFHFAQK